MTPKPTARSPKGKRMTICIGIYAQDGVVIAADAEESDGYLKRGQQKIRSWLGAVPAGSVPPSPEAAIVFTGAGDAAYIDAFTDEAINRIAPGNYPTNPREFLGEQIRRFHEQHVFPLAAASDPPWFDMLIGTYLQRQAHVFVTSKSTIRMAAPHAAVGVGGHFALSLLNQLWAGNDIARTEILAAYVILRTKERIPGCGKFTSIASLHGPRIVEGEAGQPSRLVASPLPLTYVSYEQVASWEDSFNRKWNTRETKLIHKLLEEEMQSTSKRLNSRRSRDRR
jgi:20S proteasome alpha/beta subunit